MIRWLAVLFIALAYLAMAVFFNSFMKTVDEDYKTSMFLFLGWPVVAVIKIAILLIINLPYKLGMVIGMWFLDIFE